MIESREKMLETLIKTAVLFFQRSEKLSDDMMTAGVGLIADMLEINSFSVWRNSKKSGGLYASRIYRWDKEAGDSTLLNQKPLPYIPYSRHAPQLERIFATGESACLNANDLPETSLFRSFGVNSMAFAPIFIGSTLWGFALFCDSSAERIFDDDSLEMMRTAAFLIANTVIRGEMEREIADQNELNRVMFDTAPISLTMHDDCFNAIDCNEAALTMFGATKQTYINNFYDFSPKHQPDGLSSRDKAHDLFRQAFKDEKISTEWMHQTLAGELIPCEVTLANAIYKGKHVFLVYAYDLRNVKAMEARIGKLESVVDYDALTGIINRRSFDKRLKQSMKSLSRSGGMLSLLLVDIDCFKQYNDTYGHLEGDKCLTIVAELLANSVAREDDIAARYGGEEFAIVLPNTNADGARLVAEKIHKNIRKCAIPHETSTVADHITVSIGITTGSVDHTLRGSDFIKRADEMLYQSKQKGRNQSSFASLERDQ